MMKTLSELIVAVQMPHRVFGKMLDSGDPPNNWDRLLLAAEDSIELDSIVKSSSIESSEPKDLELDDIP